jgi:Cupin-like domain
MSTGVRELQGSLLTSRAQFVREVVEPCEPVVMRGLVSAWPAVHAGTRSPRDFGEYLSRFDCGNQTEVFLGAPDIRGKYFYKDDLKGFNFERRRMRFGEAIGLLVDNRAEVDAPTLYLGSVPVSDYIPGFAAENVLPAVSAQVAPRIWLGHAAKVSAHFDAVDNVACVVAGRRVFTLYPPAAISSLYVGPIDNTMAGQPVSLADSADADDERYPLFREVKGLALTAELGPGDAIYIPKLWWHRVESTAAFNVLVNYWWDAFAAGPDAPYTSLLLSMIAISERPPAERQAWKAFFDHYVFRSQGHPLAHLPPDQHGMLGPLKPDNYGKIRSTVMHRLRGG